MSRTSQLALATLVGAVIGAGSFAAGASLTTREPEPTPTPAPVEIVAEVAAALVPATVSIETGESLGSGVIYDADGLVLTAAHVVGSREEVTVRLATGERLDGEVLGADQGRDVAVVKVEREDLPAAQMARGEPVVVGQLAVAVGSPFGFEESVTSGVVSAIGRILPREEITVEVIQTDAAINPGNSGGALADRFGRVIGINIAAREGGRAGLGFAVPIDVALEVAELLARGEEPPPVAFLGVSGTDPTSGPGGALVTEVTPQTAAEEAGLEAGDLIRSVDGLSITGMDALVREIRSRVPGDEMTLLVLRGDEELEFVVVLGDPP